MRPETGKESAYEKITFANIFVILMMIAFNEMLANQIVDVISITVITPVIVFAFVYLLMNEKVSKGMNRRFLWRAGIIIFLYNIVGFFYFEVSLWPLFYQGFIITVFGILLKIESNPIFVKDARRAYHIAFFCWLLVSSLVPVVYYYKVSYAYESDIWTRHSLLDFKEKLTNKKITSDALRSADGNYGLFYRQPYP
ncbi:MAG: hypothetical protein GY816_17500 [Cytophagales bacterium]|nr:hypothetical protein [Cytophagales bacterium]